MKGRGGGGDELDGAVGAETPRVGEGAVMGVLAALAGRLADVSASPCATCLPGSPALQKIINGVMYFAEGGLLLALMIGAVSWALGRHAGNYRVTETGKSTVLVSMVGAVLVGGAAAIINFFLGAGAGI